MYDGATTTSLTGNIISELSDKMVLTLKLQRRVYTHTSWFKLSKVHPAQLH